MHGYLVLRPRALACPFLDDLVLQPALGGDDAVLAGVLFHESLALGQLLQFPLDPPLFLRRDDLRFSATRDSLISAAGIFGSAPATASSMP